MIPVAPARVNAPSINPRGAEIVTALYTDSKYVTSRPDSDGSVLYGTIHRAAILEYSGIYGTIGAVPVPVCG